MEGKKTSSWTTKAERPNALHPKADCWLNHQPQKPNHNSNKLMMPKSITWEQIKIQSKLVSNLPGPSLPYNTNRNNWLLHMNKSTGNNGDSTKGARNGDHYCDDQLLSPKTPWRSLLSAQFIGFIFHSWVGSYVYNLAVSICVFHHVVIYAIIIVLISNLIYFYRYTIL